MSSTSSVQGDQMSEQLVDEDALTARDRKPTEKGLKLQLDQTRSTLDQPFQHGDVMQEKLKAFLLTAMIPHS